MKLTAVIVVLSLLVAGGLAVSALVAMRQASEAEREAEAQRAIAAGLAVAQDTATQELESRARQIAGLSEQIDLIRRSVPKSEVVTVTQWKTPEIRVGSDRLAGEPPSGMVVGSIKVDRGPCPMPAEVGFRIRGAHAQLRSDRGNLFVAGVAELWRTDPAPPELLGSVPWAPVPVGDFQAALEPQERPLLHALAVGWGTDNRPVVRYERSLSRRWAAWGQIAGTRGSVGVEVRW